MSCIPTDNSRKVNVIKQKFEQNFKITTDTDSSLTTEEGPSKEPLQRTLTGSPVREKKILKLNVTRQLSNPSKNIRRTPAFRGDKFTKIKNLHSPSREKKFSIVNHNVKIFEESPEKSHETLLEKEIKSSAVHEPNKNCKKDIVDYIDRRYDTASDQINSPLSRDRINSSECRVKTRVISRQKNISPIFSLDDDLGMILDQNNISEARKNDNSPELDKFIMNGVEYTKVMKDKAQKSDENNSNTLDTTSQNQIDTVIDIREELSRRKSTPSSPDPGNNSFEEESIEENSTNELSTSLKAALKAPLPNGPPPKKPPRTFAHNQAIPGPNSWLFEQNSSKSRSLSEILNKSQSLDEFSHRKLRETKKIHVKNLIDEFSTSRKSFSEVEKIPDDVKEQFSPSAKSRSGRDSKKMLEKLETVMIQHQNCVGLKVVTARRDEEKISDCKIESKTEDQFKFHNRLSRTLDSSKKFNCENRGNSKDRKHSTFDCLPYLNCASSGVYEQANFKSYFNELSPDSKSQSQDLVDSCIVNILPNNNGFAYGEPTSPTSRKLSSEFTTFLDGKLSSNSPAKCDSQVYAEPFAFDTNCGTDITGYSEVLPEEYNYRSRSSQSNRAPFITHNLSRSTDVLTSPARHKGPELHYMCTEIDPIGFENNNSLPTLPDIPQNQGNFSSFQRFLNGRPFQYKNYPGSADQIKVEHLLNQAFDPLNTAETEMSTDSNTSSDTDSIASSRSANDKLCSFNEKLQLFKNRENNIKSTKDELQRCLTEKRKHYVRRVSIKYSETQDENLQDIRNRLFDVCLLVELNLSTKEPYIKDKYPIHAKSPAWIENFCFPDAQIWPTSDSNQNQFYSLFLMDDKGNRRYGYCCRVRPEGGPILPLAYCLITKFRASGFYHKVLLELESRHGFPEKRRRNFFEALYNSEMPKPGESLKIPTTNEVDLAINDIINSRNNNKNFFKPESPLDFNAKAFPVGEGNTAQFFAATSDFYLSENVIIRSGDPRLDEKDMSQLFDSINHKILIFLFGSLLLERRVILVSGKLSQLSSCVEALQSLLYPFTWPHTFIPVLPDISELMEILQAPLPYVIGILKSKNSINTQVSAIEDGMVVDLDTSKVLLAVGDETSILPARLQKGIRSALHLVSSNTKPEEGIRNFLVSEAFLRVFVETCAHLDGYIVTQQDGKTIFQKESFVKASSSKTVQYFLEWFVETTMFNEFVGNYIALIEGTVLHDKCDIKLFVQRVLEYKEMTEKRKKSKKNFKKKTLGDRLKDLTNFYT